MAKLTAICLIYFMVAAASLTSCLAVRRLWTGTPSADKIEMQEAAMSSSSTIGTAATHVSTQFEKPTTTTKSDTLSVEQAGVVPPESDLEKNVDVDGMDPCVEDTDNGRSCHRMLRDYGPPAASKDPKHV